MAKRIVRGFAFNPEDPIGGHIVAAAIAAFSLFGAFLAIGMALAVGSAA